MVQNKEEILVERFNAWADELIIGYKSVPLLSVMSDLRLATLIDTLENAKWNLARLLKEL